MDCGYSRERINRYIDGELGYAEVAELQDHLSFCAACAAELTEAGEVRRAMADWGGLELAPPTGFAERVLTAAALEPAPGTPRSIGRVVEDVFEKLDETLGRVPLPGGRTIPVKTIVGWGLAAVVAIELERRHLRHARQLRASSVRAT